MFKNMIIISLLICLSFPLIAQVRDEDFFEMEYKQKSARRAMLYSMIFPGAGQIYANPKAITGYIFPIIEIGLWVGYFHYYNEGLKIEDSYEKWANKENIGTPENPIYRYQRDRQNFAQNDLILNPNSSSMYDNHFRLDDSNTQHFYEDIGKYNKYIFGWADWFDIYATDADGDGISPDWEFDSNKWIGNNVQNEASEYYQNNSAPYNENSGIYSGLRAEYIEMRKEAEENYNTAKLLSIGAAFNRVISAFDALRVTNRQNMAYLAKHDVNIKLSPVFVNNQISAGLFVQKRF